MGYVVKRTATYDNGQTNVSWVKSVGWAMWLTGRREEAKVFPTKAAAKKVVPVVSSAYQKFEIEKVE